MAGMKKAAGDGAEPELTGDLAKPGKRGGKKPRDIFLMESRTAREEQ